MKRGQITIFIIIGLVLLLSTATVIYINERTHSFQQSLVIPEDVFPVQQFVESCILTLGTDGIQAMGAQGGYVTLPTDITNDPTAYLTVDTAGIAKIPLWYHIGQSRILTPEQARFELATYIDNNLPQCLNFDAFSQFEIERGEIFTDVTLAEKDVKINVETPITITNAEGDKTELFMFTETIPVQLKNIIELAGNIVQEENNNLFFENLTIDLMTASDAIPFTGLEVDCTHREWETRLVKAEVQNIIHNNLQLIRVKGTDHIPFEQPDEVYEELAQLTPEPVQGRLTYPGLVYNSEAKIIQMPDNLPSDSYYYWHYFFDPHKEAKDLRVSFYYDDTYGMDFDVQPSDSGIMTTKQAQGARRFLSFMCMDIYHFTYDLRYPIEVRIYDPTAFSDTGYAFSFAFPVTIDNNAGVKGRTDLQRIQSAEFDAQFCNNLGDDVVEIKASGFIDGIPTAQYIEDINISYTCFNKYCKLGETSFGLSADPSLIVNLPAGCTSPFLFVEEENFLSEQVQLAPDQTEIEIPVTRTIPFRYSVQKVNYDLDINPATGSRYGFSGDFQDASQNRNTTIFIDYLDDEFTQYGAYPHYEDINTIRIPEVGGNFTLEMSIFDSTDTIRGGIIDSNWTIEAADLIDKEEIIFKIPEFIPFSISNQNTITELLVQENLTKFMKPEFR